MTRGRRSNVGDTRIAPNGYHYTRTKERWELTSRLIVERELGRKLEVDERVVFIDGDRTNITPDNLRVTRHRASTAAKRKAILQAKVDELVAALEDLEH